MMPNDDVHKSRMKPPIELDRIFRLIMLCALAMCILQVGCDHDESADLVPHPSRASADVRISAPIDAEAVIQRAGSLIEQSRYEEAEQLLMPLLLVQTNQSGGLFLLAQVKAGQGKIDNAIETLEEISPDDRALGLSALGQAADWLIQSERYGDAEAKLRQILLRDPEITIAQRRLAQLLNNQGRRIQAAPHLRKLAELGDTTPEELYGMITFSDPFIHTNTDGADVEIPTIGLAEARLLYQRGEFRAAETMTDRLWREEPHSASITAFYLRLLAEMQNRAGFARMLGQLPEGISCQPEYWHALGIFQQREEKHDVAIRCFLEAVCLDDTDRSSYLGLARSLRAMGQDIAANEVLERYAILDEIASINISPDRTAEQMRRMPTLLRKLHRDAEANAWERIARGGVPHVSPEVNSTEDTETPLSDDLWVTCGIAVDDWPLPPSTESIASALAAQENESENSSITATQQAISLIGSSRN